MTLSEEFLERGIVKLLVANRQELDRIRSLFVNECGDLDTWHARRTETTYPLNDLRLILLSKLNDCFKPDMLSLAKEAIYELVGNELVKQRRINLSIQLPGDDSSLLPIHCDTWSGDSPYEVVLWVPLVDCYGTKSMFFSRRQPPLKGKTPEQLYAECDPYFVDCKYGECLIFSQNFMHGNVVNTTNETRWSMNCRFKSALSPYGDKKLGEFFEPISIRPATKLGMRYEYPEV